MMHSEWLCCGFDVIFQWRISAAHVEQLETISLEQGGKKKKAV